MDLAGEQVTPIQKGTKETRQLQRYGDVMRLHEAAPKLIIQERVGDKVKVSSYWPVPELTRAESTLGRLQLVSPPQCHPLLFQTSSPLHTGQHWQLRLSPWHPHYRLIPRTLYHVRRYLQRHKPCNLLMCRAH